ncbi:SMC family ATPase [Methanoculleus sp. FWC-SCC1]|uniref:SMC family ATPase n=1 Tax=Methanoculleus frigidifontis TaxID=2584085 RepID=A0ABT8M7N2_9EURY|nr:SMC family ATPase [Methanoculleus sp. FWC-SCC1]MDN7023934.1 SMC family ATPase [Methanoculleus sp. FWC-SCC1]
MLLHKLVMRNFKRYRDQEIVFCDGITGVVGNNGAGKSSIIEAILFALYGLSGTGLDGEYIVSAFAGPQDSCEIRLDFSVGGNDYAVVRRFRKRASSALHEARMFLNGRPFGEYADGVQNVQRGIQRVVGMAPTDFKNTIYAGQKDLLSLLESRPGSRRDWFLQVLGLDYLKKDSMDALRERIGGCEKQLANLTGRLEELDDAAVRDEVHRLKEEQKAARLSLSRIEEVRSGAAARRDEAKAERDRVLEQRQQHLRLTADEVRRSEEVQGLLQECRELEAEIAAAESLRGEMAGLAGLAAREGDLEREVAGYAEKKAAVERLEADIAHLTEQLRQQEERRGSLEAELAALRECDAERTALEQQLARWDDVNGRLERLKAAEPGYAAVKDELSRLDERFRSVERRVAGVRVEIDDAEAQSRRLEALEAAGAEYEILRARDALLARAAGHADRQQVCRREIDDLARQVSDAEAQIRDLEAASAGAGEIESRIASLSGRREELRSIISLAAARRQALQQDLEKTVRNREDLLLTGPEGACPTCHRHLGERFDDLLGDLAAGAASLQESLAAIDGDYACAKEESAGVDAKLALLEEQRRQQEDLQRGLALCRSRRDDVAARLAKWRDEYGLLDAAIRDLGLAGYDAGEHESVRRKLAVLEEQRSAADRLRGVCSRLPALREERKRLIAEVEEYLGRKDSLEADLGALGFDPDEKQRLEHEREVLEAAYREYTRLEALVARMPQQREECVTVGARIDALKQAIRDAAAEQELLAFDPAVYLRLQEEYRRAGEARRRMTELEVRTGEIPRLSAKLGKKQADLRLRQEECLRLRQEIAGLGFDERQVAAAEEALAACEAALQVQVEEHLRMTGEVHRIERDIERSEQALARIRELARSCHALREEAELLRLTRKAIADYIVYLLQVVRDRIEDEAGRILGEITDGRYDTVLLDDDFSVLVNDMGEDYPADRFSGGEQDDIAIALRIALSRFLAEVNELHDSTFLIFDEIFGSQDEGRRSNLVRALRTQESYFPQIFLISHIAEVQDEFSSTLLVEMGADRTSSVKEIC